MANSTYELNNNNALQGVAALNEFEELTKNPVEISNNLLMQIVRDNENTEYGKKYNFKKIKSYADYKKNVPVVVYDDIGELVNRMKDGEKNILTAYDVKNMLITSGTDKTPKAIPITVNQLAATVKYTNIPNGVLANNIDEKWKNGHMFSPTEAGCKKLPSGIVFGSASSVVTNSAKSGIEPYATIVKSLYTSPATALTPHEGADSIYVHIRFALMQKDVTGVVCAFSSYLIQNLLYIYNNYELLINDIEKGEISSSINLSEDYRQELMALIEPMPERAAELREVFKNGPDVKFMKLIWPDLMYVRCIGGDGFSVYTDMMKNRFLGEDVPIIYSGIVSSEGLFSQPVAINDLNSVLCVGGIFLEFLPAEFEDDVSKAVDISEVEVGRDYELIITNLSGFYRYRIGDVVKITGYHNATPTVQFMYRTGKTINMVGEKTTESALKITVNETAAELGFELLDYAVYPDRSSMPAKYVFLIETYSEKRFSIKKEKLCAVLKEKLYKANAIMPLVAEHLLPPEVYFEQPETQFLYRDLMVMKGAAPSQVKPVHVITNEEQRKFFMRMREE